MCTPGKPLPAFAALLAHPRAAGRCKDGLSQLRSKPIAVVPARRTSFDRMMLVGDAAGRVKPTTAGGIPDGVAYAEITARVLDEGLRAGELSARRLGRDEQAWRAEMGRELRVGSYFRRVGERLSEEQMDRLVLSYREPEVHDLVARHASLERLSGFVSALARSPLA